MRKTDAPKVLYVVPNNFSLIEIPYRDNEWDSSGQKAVQNHHYSYIKIPHLPLKGSENLIPYNSEHI